MNFDFAALLVFLTLFSGGIWLFDRIFLYKKRQALADAEFEDETSHNKAIEEPWPVEYARSFFPIFLIVLLLRSFLVEPFRIPSGSMMPTLLIGDFILVNKYDYGIRLPVINTKIFDVSNPERGDIVVFRYPKDPKIPFIKRVVGLPGDAVAYVNKRLYINGTEISNEDMGKYTGYGSGEMMTGARIKLEDLDGVKHEILEVAERGFPRVELIVPEGHYFVLGDNRDNSRDSRFWGTVPDENLVGRAFMIWMSWDGENDGIIDWKRLGTILE